MTLFGKPALATVPCFKKQRKSYYPNNATAEIINPKGVSA